MSSKEEEYKELFQAEAIEGLEELNRVLTSLEKKPDDMNLINTVFRVTHTMKGNATGMGFSDIAGLAHVMEDLFGEVRNGSIKLDANMFAALFKGLDILSSMVSNLSNDKKIAFRGIKTKLQVILNNAKASTTEEETLAKEGEEKKEETSVKEASTAQPKGKRKTTKASKKSSAKQPKKENSKAPADADETSNKLKKEDSPQENKETLPEIDQLMGQMEEAQLDATEEIEDHHKIKFSDLVQVPVRKLDNLLNLVGELIIERDRIIAMNAYGDQGNDYTRLNRISSDLQYSVMDVRLVQVGFLFNKFHRVVRDAAHAENKRVRLELKGIDTEIDRNILQIISDSLIHLIRNCVSHGIEAPEDRKKAGKSEEGLIRLSAENDSDGVILRIMDDGKGIDVQKVKSKAIESGLINKDMIQLMQKEEVLMLIFEAGFSTKEEVSELSGRGVGMDVVKKAIDSISGNIKVETEEGKGTTIVLKLPASMAVKGTLLFLLDQQTYAIPLSYTEAVISLYKNDIHKVGSGLLSHYLNKSISIVFLKDLFEQQDLEEVNLQTRLDALHPEQKLDVVIVTYNGRTIGLIVDKLLQQKEIVEKPLQKPLDQIKFLSGVTILGNGHVCPVINITAISNAIFNLNISNKKVK